MSVDLLLVGGARPNFMKLAPIHAAAARQGMRTVLVHTGQHYDARMSDVFFSDLGLPVPDHQLGVGSGSHAKQTASVMEAFEPVLLRARPRWLVVVGDVNSTLACALVAVKLKAETGSQTAHVEAGLRSGDWGMPEEINRVLTDRVADVLLTPSRDARANLLAEGIPGDRIEFVGNVMIDVLLGKLEAARALAVWRALGVKAGNYVVATLHRPSNVDSRESLLAILDGLKEIAKGTSVVLPLHPRTRARITEFGLEDRLEGMVVVEPQGYLAMLSLLDSAQLVMTDSGGIQEETTVLGVPCITLREQTERPVTISEGTNRLAAWPLSAASITRDFHEAVGGARFPVCGKAPEGWDGKAAERIVRRLTQ